MDLDEAQRKRAAELGVEVDAANQRKEILQEGFTRTRDKIVDWQKRRLTAAADFILTRAGNSFMTGFDPETVKALSSVNPEDEVTAVTAEQSAAITSLIPDVVQWVWCLSADQEELAEAFVDEGYFKKQAAMLAASMEDFDWPQAINDINALILERQSVTVKPKPQRDGKKKRKRAKKKGRSR